MPTCNSSPVTCLSPYHLQKLSYSSTFCMIGVTTIVSRYFNVARKPSLLEMLEER
uniref:Uncharacterized protein n=1 Tax=Arundo donax TaxID=35708 RepID=A0A0A9CL89_ARUDO